MSLEIHNTLSGRRERFVPLRAGEVSFYTCGPTVYDYAHIGNFRSFLAADVLRRWLESPLCAQVDPARGEPTGAFGYRVTHVMNLTDVGHMTDDAAADGAGVDKMQAAQKRLLDAKKSGALPPGVDVDARDPRAIAEFYADAFLEDARLMGLKVAEDAEKDPSLLPRPSRMIREMLGMILDLIEKKHAYIAPDGVVYFDVASFPGYGRLSGNTLERLRAGAGGRVSDAHQAQKKNPADFMLWKPDPAHLMRWDPSEVLGRPVPIKEGYPGWHIECSAMARQRLGDVIDIHSGGEDNIFPHHECEIAQSRGATGAEFFARYWFHPRHLFVEGEKMSKSAGNFFTIRNLISRGFEPAAIRLELIKTHYRSNANFTEQGLRDSAKRVRRWRNLARTLKAVDDSITGSPVGRAAAPAADIANALRQVTLGMDSDLNISAVLAVLDSRSKGYDTDKDVSSLPESPISPDDAYALLREDKSAGSSTSEWALLHLIDNILGVIFVPKHTAVVAPDDKERIDSLIAERAEARKSRDFAKSDEIRDRLAEMGIEIKDGPDGATWSRRARL